MIEVMITRFGESNGNGNDYWFQSNEPKSDRETQGGVNSDKPFLYFTSFWKAPLVFYTTN